MTVIRIHALLSGHQHKTYLSGAPSIFEAVKSLEALLSEQNYSFRIYKAERVAIPA